MALRKVIAFTEKTTPDFRAPWPLRVSARHLGIDQELFDHKHLLRHLRLLHGICRSWEKSKWGKSQPSAQDKRLAAPDGLHTTAVYWGIHLIFWQGCGVQSHI